MPIEYTIQDIADTVRGEVVGDTDKMIDGVAPFDTAGANQITFAGTHPYLKRLDTATAGAIIVPRGIEAPGKTLITVKNPQLAFATVVTMYHPTVKPPAGISDQICMGEAVKTGQGVFIGAFTTIGHRVTIGRDSIIHNGVFIGDDVTIGDNVVIHPNVTIMNDCRIGNRVTIFPGTVIGSDGYGFVPENGRYHKIPQIGIVQIDDDVEIGACNTIDRATFGRTWIQRGVKIDNLVHIAHNVVIGEDSIVVSQVGIAGSTTVGHHAILAGQVGISGHLTIGNQVTIGPKTGVAKSILEGEVVSSGSPAMPHKTWLRVQRVIPTLPEMKKKIAELEQKVAEMEEIIRGR